MRRETSVEASFALSDALFFATARLDSKRRVSRENSRDLMQTKAGEAWSSVGTRRATCLVVGTSRSPSGTSSDGSSRCDGCPSNRAPRTFAHFYQRGQGIVVEYDHEHPDPGQEDFCQEILARV